MRDRPVLATRVMRARKVSECPACRQAIRVGDLIAKCGFWMHAHCAIAHQHATDVPANQGGAAPKE